jgi:glyoxylase-like metal-dependent hydrolase (beta-lactamase superfamily II)
MLKRVGSLCGAWLALAAMQGAPADKKPTDLSLWRLDCGQFAMKDFGAFFSDTFAYKPGQPKAIASSCYLIRHANRYMLWDTGVTGALAGKTHDSPAQTMTLKRTIVDQLKDIGVRPDQIEIIGISHYHADHTGQASDFPRAKLVIGKGDFDALKGAAAPGGGDPSHLKHWLSGGGTVLEATGDVDVFEDGRVIMLDTPGHTPGHNALLVKLQSGNVLLTGDLYHFTEQVAIKGVPPFNTDRADTLASMDRFDKIAKNLDAKVIIQHEPADIAKLPLFPKAAR